MYRLPQKILLANFLSFFPPPVSPYSPIQLLGGKRGNSLGREEILCQERKFLELEEAERHCKPFFFLDFIEY